MAMANTASLNKAIRSTWKASFEFSLMKMKVQKPDVPGCLGFFSEISIEGYIYPMGRIPSLT